MGWVEMLSRTYDACSHLAGKEINDDPILLPVAHSTVNAQIEITVDMEGNLIKPLTGIVEKDRKNEITIIPVTEDSASRSNGNFPHPLCDKLCYVAGDYSHYTGDAKEDYFESYLAGLNAWVESEYTHPWLLGVYRYVRKGSMIADLASIGILKLDENGMLSENENKIHQLSQWGAVVRFAVEEEGHKIELWRKQEIFEAYVNYYTNAGGKKGLCYVSGEMEVCTDKHPSKIRNTGDKAKLISGNDDSGFTYRGRFLEKDEAVSISYLTSQKAHNALRWLLQRQGNTKDGNAIVVWKIPEDTSAYMLAQDVMAVPNIFENTPNAFEFDFEFGMHDIPEEIPKSDDEAATGRRYAILLNQAMKGYAKKITRDDKVIMIALDAATTGRLSINYYHEFVGNEFIDSVIEWHRTCKWKRCVKHKKTGKYIWVENAPSPEEIAKAAYGTERGQGYLDCDKNLVKNTIQRILPCIVGLSPKIPADIVHAAVVRASNPQAYSPFVWENYVFAVACAMIQYNKEKSKKERDGKMDAERERAMLFGGLLAIMDDMEQKALYDPEKNTSDKRLTNAKKLWSTYVRKPKTTFERLHSKIMQAYIERLSGGSRYYFENEIMILVNRLNEIERFDNRPLKEEYLLGYYEQKEKMKTRKNDKNEIEAEGGNE